MVKSVPNKDQQLHTPTRQVDTNLMKKNSKAYNSKNIGVSKSNSHSHSHSNVSSKDKYLEMKPTKSNTSSNKSNLDGLALIQRGNEYFFSDCYLEATGYYYQAAMILKGSMEHRVERSKAWSNVAECHLRLQNWQAAQDAASNAVAADPNNAKALYRRAKARFELADYKGAAKDADAVGTRDAQDVAALCRELAQTAVTKTKNRKTNKNQHHHHRHRNRQRDESRQDDFVDSSITESTSSNNPLTDRGVVGRGVARYHAGIITASGGGGGVRDPPPEQGPLPPPPVRKIGDRELWFRRIIDSYRLRVDDEYTKTGATDGSCLYGIRAKGGRAPPFNHFRYYVQRALKKRVLPLWFTLSEMDPLCHLATTDTFSNINIAGIPEEIDDFYTELGFPGELEVLRDMGMYIEGPIGMPWDDSNPSPRIEAPRLTPSWGVRYEDRPLPNAYDLSEKLSGGQAVGPQQPYQGTPRSPPRHQQQFGPSFGGRGHQPQKYRYGPVSSGPRYPSPSQHARHGQQNRYPAAPDSRDDYPTHHPQRESHHHLHEQFPPVPSRRDHSSRPPYAPVNIIDKRNGEYHYAPQNPPVIRRQGSRPESYHNLMVPKIRGRTNSNSKTPGHAGNVHLDRKQSLSGCPITDGSESTNSIADMELDASSYGPQLPYRLPSDLLPGQPVQSYPTGDKRTGDNKPQREFYSSEETSTEQSVQNGTKDERDEVFSDLTELSP